MRRRPNNPDALALECWCISILEQWGLLPMG